ncbi:endonuclease/exonuclease/phosphatase family protein [Flavobacterium lacus]|uniref:Endonuclease/exonuclease/phosphatase family metal-dependent hydrolase n=1 Tax=Flavobacterium lacus TaxID=1353778 RepID=A0A328WVA0_9FLAO|nr:endonuclease/exonuclease/phosphatase family protein [Flavobacterium lacus]RAR50270.1 endonuclease/exonuclease/phosphatase family metal-dependent hydrolase [Flavobacterium lacus]
MKKIILVVLMMVSNYFFGQDLKVMTYNIRLDLARDGENSWSNRKENISNLINFYEPDIFGIQEGLPHQVQFLDSILLGYKVVGEGRDGGKNGEHSSIFYKSSKFELIECDTFWLSETPDEVSKGWDAALNRICTYGIFKDNETKQLFCVFNTHFDHVGEVARNKSAQLIHQKVSQLNTKDYPVMIMGDFNLEPQSEPILFLSNQYNHVKSDAKLIYNSGGTFNGFEFHKPILKEKEIDHIFVSKKSFEIKKYAVLTDSYSCKYPSDHFPVLVELKFLK